MSGGPPTVRAVVFDLDGTLVDSMPMVLRAFAHALEPFCPPRSDEELLARLGGPPERTFRQLIGEARQVPEAMRRLREFTLANWHLIQPFPGMHSLLDDLRGGGCQIGLWTGRERESTEWILREQNLTTRVDACVCGDDLPTHKPHPAGLAATLGKLSVAGDEALFVGDADVDVLAGTEAGVRTVLIRHGRPVDAEILSKAWQVVETPEAAYAVVRLMALKRGARR